MKIESKANELVSLLEKFVDGEIVADKLQSFVWDIIAYFTDAPKDKIPPISSGEGLFWNAIWSIQHLADEEHMGNIDCRKQVEDTLAYLKHEKKLPSQYLGKRPKSLSEK